MKTIQINGTITVPDDLFLGHSNIARSNVGTDVNGLMDVILNRIPVPEQQNLGRYAGKFVFVERVRKPTDTQQTYSSYYNGEYFCVRSTQNSLYLVKPQAGWNGHQLKSLNLFPGDNTESYEVLSAYDDDSTIKNFIKEQEKWIEDAGKGKRQYVEGVYTEAQSTLNQVKRALENR